MKGFDSDIKILKKGTVWEAVDCMYGVDSLTCRFLTKLSPREVKNICIPLEMPGMIKEEAIRYSENIDGRLADIDVHIPGVKITERLSRYNERVRQYSGN